MRNRDLAAIGQPVLDGPRIYLRRLTAADVAPEYLRWMNDPDTGRYLESRLSRHDLQSLTDFVAGMAADPLNFLAGIFLKDGGRHIGNIKLGPIDPFHRRAVVGLLIGEQSCWGKGFATEAISLVTQFAFEEVGLHRVTAGAYADNVGSVRAFEKAGWRQEARLPSHWRCGEGYQDGILLGCINPSEPGSDRGPAISVP